MGNKFSVPKIRRPSVSGSDRSEKPEKFESSTIDNTSVTVTSVVDTIHDANFSWLDGRRVSGDHHLFERYGEDANRLSHLMHVIFKYILNGNTRTSISPEMKNCLHIGTGHYIWLIEMASDYKNILFEGFDITLTAENANSASPLPPNLKFTFGNIFSGGLPYPDEYFDYVNVRSFLTFLRGDQIAFVLNEISRVTKSGGWIEILEIDVLVKNGASIYEDNLGKIWREICDYKGYNPSNIINLDKFLHKEKFSEIKNSKLSIPIGRYGGKVGDLYARQFVNGSKAVAALIADKLNMTDEAIQLYLQECVEEFNTKLTYSNSYLICAKKI